MSGHSDIDRTVDDAKESMKTHDLSKVIEDVSQIQAKSPAQAAEEMKALNEALKKEGLLPQLKIDGVDDEKHLVVHRDVNNPGLQDKHALDKDFQRVAQTYHSDVWQGASEGTAEQTKESKAEKPKGAQPESARESAETHAPAEKPAHRDTWQEAADLSHKANLTEKDMKELAKFVQENPKEYAYIKSNLMDNNPAAGYGDKFEKALQEQVVAHDAQLLAKATDISKNYAQSSDTAKDFLAAELMKEQAAGKDVKESFLKNMTAEQRVDLQSRVDNMLKRPIDQ